MDLRKFFTHLEEPPSSMRLKILVKRVMPRTITSAAHYGHPKSRKHRILMFLDTPCRDRHRFELLKTQKSVRSMWRLHICRVHSPPMILLHWYHLPGLRSAGFAGESVLCRLSSRIWASLGSKGLWTRWRMIRTRDDEGRTQV